jgi:hypothetical protein
LVRLIPPPATAGFLGVNGWLLASSVTKVAAGKTLAFEGAILSKPKDKGATGADVLDT